MYIAIPEFQEIDQWMGYSEEERMEAALEYTKVLPDVRGKSESFAALYRQVRSASRGNPRNNGESAKIIVSVYMGFSPIRALFTIRPI